MPLPAWGAGREVGASPVAKRVRRALPLALFLWRGSALHSRAAFETFEQSVRRMRQLFFFSQFVLQENESPALHGDRNDLIQTVLPLAHVRHPVDHIAQQSADQHGNGQGLCHSRLEVLLPFSQT